MEGVKLITPFYMEDERGYFMKKYEKDIYQSWGLEGEMNEQFETYSKKNVIRGMHFQIHKPQIKIISATRGVVNDVIVDLRKNSKTFGRYLEIELTEENKSILWIPAGFAHGFEVLSEEAVIQYQCIGKYDKESDTGIRWDDEELGISWKTISPIVSQKDRNLMNFKEFVKKYQWLEV